MGDVLEEEPFMPHPDVIKQDQMLVYLAHVADVWCNGEAEVACEEANGQKLADAAYPDAICLDIMTRVHLQVIFEHDCIR
jgi:hypothetical protein